MSNESKLDTSGIENLVANIVTSLQQAITGITAPNELKRADWPRIKRSDISDAGKQLKTELTKAREQHQTQIDARRSEIGQTLEARKRRLELAVNPKVREIHAKNGSFIVSGRIVDEETGVGLPYVSVKAFDMDRKYEDRLGKTRTDENGYYAIEYSAKEFKEVFDAQPETYIEVLDAGGNSLFTSPRSFVHKAGEVEKINATVEGTKVASSLALAKSRQLSLAIQRRKTEVRKSELLISNQRLPVK